MGSVMPSEQEAAQALLDSVEPVTLPLPSRSADDLAPEVEDAVKFLEAAQRSCENALTAAKVMRALRRKAEGKKSVGQLSDSDQDLLRTGILFAGAGLDSTLKQLVRDALDEVTRRSPVAEERLRDFAATAFQHRDLGVDTQVLATMFISDHPSPRAVLLDLYKSELLSGSLQSCEKVNEICRALGLDDRELGNASSLRALH